MARAFFLSKAHVSTLRLPSVLAFGNCENEKCKFFSPYIYRLAYSTVSAKAKKIWTT